MVFQVERVLKSESENLTLTDPGSLNLKIERVIKYIQEYLKGII